MRLEDIARLGASGFIASVQPTHATSDMPWAEARVGPERIRGRLRVAAAQGGGRARWRWAVTSRWSGRTCSPGCTRRARGRTRRASPGRVARRPAPQRPGGARGLHRGQRLRLVRGGAARPAPARHGRGLRRALGGPGGRAPARAGGQVRLTVVAGAEVFQGLSAVGPHAGRVQGHVRVRLPFARAGTFCW